MPGAGGFVFVLAQSFERLLLSRGHGPDLQHVVLRWHTRAVGGRTVYYCAGVPPLLVLVGCLIFVTLFVDVLGDQGRGSHKSHPFSSITETTEISEATSNYGETTAVRDHAHQATNAHQVLLHHLLHHPLDGVYPEITHIFCCG